MHAADDIAGIDFDAVEYGGTEIAAVDDFAVGVGGGGGAGADVVRADHNVDGGALVVVGEALDAVERDAADAGFDAVCFDAAGDERGVAEEAGDES